MDNNKSIELDFIGNLSENHLNCCAFNIDNEFIIYDETNRIICIYDTTSDRWRRKRTYKLPKGFTLISISKYNKIYLLSENYIYEWNYTNDTSTSIWSTSYTMKKIL